MLQLRKAGTSSHRVVDCKKARIQAIEEEEPYQQQENVAPFIVMIEGMTTADDKEHEMMIAAMPEGVNAMFLLDSGSCVHACPKEFAAWHGLAPHANKVSANTADGSPIKDYGQRAIKYRAEGGLNAQTTFHVMNVKRPILSVGVLECEGFPVSFGKNPNIIFGPHKCSLVKVGNLYYLPVKLDTDISAALTEKRSTMLYEWCCEPDSKLSQWFIDHGHGARRLCLPKYDMSKVEVVEAITRQMLLDERRGYTIVMWASLPCTRWSTWQFVNATLSQETFNKIQMKRELSMRIIRLMVLTMNTLAERLPVEHFIRAFEWPRGAVGWHSQDIKKVINLMPKLCETDGCQYDVKDGKGLAVKEPWRVVTNHSPWVKALGRGCQGEHQHGQCRGPVAEASGVYTSRLAAIVGKAIAGDENKAALIAVQDHEEPGVHDHGMKEAGAP